MPKDSQNICDELKSTVVCHVWLVCHKSYLDPTFWCPASTIPYYLFNLFISSQGIYRLHPPTICTISYALIGLQSGNLCVFATTPLRVPNLLGTCSLYTVFLAHTLRFTTVGYQLYLPWDTYL